MAMTLELNDAEQDLLHNTLAELVVEFGIVVTALVSPRGPMLIEMETRVTSREEMLQKFKRNLSHFCAAFSMHKRICTCSQDTEAAQAKAKLGDARVQELIGKGEALLKTLQEEAPKPSMPTPGQYL